MSKKMVAVAIGVRNAKPLPYIAGAITSAKRFDAWAEAMGYDHYLITDEVSELTVSSLRSTFDQALQNVPIHRLMVYFAGHGMIRELDSGLWFLSDWRKEGYVISYEALRQRLSRYDINQITIISDACRVPPKTLFQIQLEERSVLGYGGDLRAPDVDKFIATRDGEPTFAIADEDASQSVCIFSGVLVDALSGNKEEAFSKAFENCVTSSSLGSYLKVEVPRVALRYGLTLNPYVAPAFPEEDNVYYKRTDQAFLPPTFWPKVPELSSRVDIRDKQFIAPKDLVLSADETKPIRTTRTRKWTQPPPNNPYEAGLIVQGASIKGLWSLGHIRIGKIPGYSWFSVGDLPLYNRLSQPVPVIVQFSTGVYGAITILPFFFTEVVVNSDGINSITYTPRQASDTNQFTQDVIAALNQGALHHDSIVEIAIMMRQSKHLDPMMGVFAAYLYNSIGDLASIRQLAYFYAAAGQPIPYDIALLADIPGYGNPALKVQVPAVSVRQPRNTSEANRPWSFDETPSISGIVGGRWPWLRQGWAYLDESEPKAAMAQHLGGASRHLLESRFPTLTKTGAELLIQRFKFVLSNPQTGV